MTGETHRVGDKAVLGETMMLFDGLHHVVMTYGYLAVFLAIMIESAGIPFPGETTLIGAALYAGSTGKLEISLIIFCAAAGAIVGDNIGYWVGRRFGLPLLAKYGCRIGLNERKLRTGQYLFEKHGGKVVFFGRFVALLRVLAAVLAGANKMEWTRFFAYNVAGGVIWATLFGGGAYWFGAKVAHLMGPLGIVLLVVAIILGAWSIHHFNRHGERLEAEATKDMERKLALRASAAE